VNYPTLKQLVIMAGGGTILGASLLVAAGRQPPMTKATYSSWLAYWDTLHGRQALYSSGSALEEVELFAYHFNEEGDLVPASANFKDLQDAYSQFPGSKKPRLAVTLVNDIENGSAIRLKDPACVHKAIFEPAARDAHIRQILAIAQGAESIDVDYERVAQEDGSAFTSFIKDLATQLHQKGKRISVVLEPRVSDQSTSDPLSNGSHALSWPDLAQSADQLTVMAYLYHYGGSGPGSIAPIDWIGDVAAYSRSQIPPEKLSIALHLGGYDWPKDGPGKSLEFDKANALAAAYGTSITLDRKTKSGYFFYSDAAGKHEVWIETADGLKAKVEMLRRAGIAHIAFWRLGAGDPAFWDDLNKI
jgi:spore germination protein